MPLHSRNIGQNLVFWQGHQKRIIDAYGPDVVKWSSDFVNKQLVAADAPLGWTVTLVEAGAGESTITSGNVTGGVLLLTTDANDNDGINMQLTGEAFKMTTSQAMAYYGIRLQANEVVQSDLLVGLCITDTDLLGGLTDGAYFRKVDGSAVIETITEKNSGETATAAVKTLIVDTWTTLELVYDYAMSVPHVYFFVDGVQVAEHLLTIPDDEELTPSIHFLSGSVGAKILSVDWLNCFMIGRTG